MAYIGNNLQSTSFVTDVFAGDNSTTAFTLSRTPASVTALAVFVDGVKQASIGGSGAYTLTGSVLNFTAAPPTNAIIEVMHLGVQSLVNVPADATVTASALAPELRNILADQFTANGTGTTFSLTYPPISSNSVIVTANGVVQYDYSVSGSTLILNFTPANGTIIRAAGMGNILTTGTITDDSVSTAKLQTGAVTGTKIAASTITVDKVAFGTVLDKANSGSSYANSAFVAANTPSYTANSAASYANSAFTTANSSFDKANNALTAGANTSTSVQFGSFGVGTAASGTSGEIRATNNITAYYSSDKRYKNNIINIQNPLEKLEKINGVEFDWSEEYMKNHGGEDGYFIRKHDIGVIAQELEEILPEIVITREDGYKAVKYDRIVALLIEALKELKKEVNSIKGK